MLFFQPLVLYPLPGLLQLLLLAVDVFDPQDIQKESKDRDTDDQAPGAEEVLAKEQDNEGVEDRQFRLAGHEFRIQDIGFQGVQDSDHDQNVDHVLDPADRISHQRQRDQGNDHSSHRDQAADEDHEAQGKNLRHLHDGQADNSQSRVADGNQELGFQHHPEGIGKLTAKVGNVFKKPAKEVGLQKRLAEGLHFF